MEVSRYLLIVIFHWCFVNNCYPTRHQDMHNGIFLKQSNFITTRIPLINRVRERLTSILMHNHDHLVHHHSHLHQQYHNHFGSIFNLITTTPISTGITETNLALTENTGRTTVTNAVNLSTTSTTSTSTTLSPMINSGIVTISFNFNNTIVPSSTEAQSTDSSTLSIDSTTKTDFTLIKTTESSAQPSTEIKTLGTSTTTTEESTLETESTTKIVKTTFEPTEITISTTTKQKDPCDDRTNLYANGMKLITLCYIKETLTWHEARAKCLSINYRLFEVNSYLKEVSAFKYFVDNSANNEFRWINGIALNLLPSTEWYVSDPDRPWNYTSNSWFGLVKAPVPGFCLGLINLNNGTKFTTKPCQSYHSTFWCEY